VRNIITILLCVSALCSAEVRKLTLKEAVDLAIRQNPDVILAKFDEQKAQAAVRVARDPFVPKVYAGSGLAWTHGFPMSIDGSAPSIFQARTDMALFNRQRSYELAQARENARGAAIDSASKSDEAVYRTASLFLDAAQLERMAKSVRQETESLEHVAESVRLRVTEGREIPIEGKRAEVNLARARQRLESLSADLSYAQETLALVLGFSAGDRVQPSEDERPALETPATENASVQAALDNSRETRKLESQLQAKGFEVRAQKAARMPELGLVAQYALFAQFNNFQDYFRKFQRNNAELGVSVKIPLLIGSAPAGLAAEAQSDIGKLKAQMNDTRNRIAVETRKSFQDIRRAESARDVAKLDLELSREQVTVLLAQLDEGRTTRQAVEEARFLEQEKWLAYFDGQHTVEKAKLSLLRQTGTLLAALR
jgi:outer membrane protein